MAMDHRGQPIPLLLGARDNPVPLHCPRCDEEHCHWSPACPFDDFGDHANLRSAFSQLPSKQGAALTGEVKERLREAVLRTSKPRSHGGNSPPRPRNEEVGKPVDRLGAQQAYYCIHCGRRLLRMDHKGTLVPMERDPNGALVPLECPGCGQNHTMWVVLGLHDKFSPRVVEEGPM